MSSRAGWIALIAGIVLRASLIVMIAACRTGVVGPARPVIVVESPA